MAKQSGLHQIRGKVGEHSYYKQSGVADGLIRSINQGMSARVKTGEEYANTRLNNAEFGQACRIAAVLGKQVTPKYRPMILPFSQSKMARLILEVIKTNTGNWGQRNIGSGDVDVLVDALSSVSKNDFSTYGVTLSESDGEVQTDNSLCPAKLAAIGADGYTINSRMCTIGVGKFQASTGVYTISLAKGIDTSHDVTADDSASLVGSFPAAYPSMLMTSFNVYVIVVMPFRTINSEKHILQEHCTFGVFASATQPA